MVILVFRLHIGGLISIAAGFTFYALALVWALHSLRRYWELYGIQIIGRFKGGNSHTSPPPADSGMGDVE